jgi:hypothetical protein
VYQADPLASQRERIAVSESSAQLQAGPKNKTAGFIDLSVEESGDFFRQRR